MKKFITIMRPNVNVSITTVLTMAVCAAAGTTTVVSSPAIAPTTPAIMPAVTIPGTSPLQIRPKFGPDDTQEMDEAMQAIDMAWFTPEVQNQLERVGFSA